MAQSSNLEGALARLEQQRLAVKKRIVKATIAVVLYTIIVAPGLFLFLAPIYGMISFILGVAVFAWFRTKERKGVSSLFKKEIMTVLASDIDPSLHYTESGWILEQLFNESALYQSPDRYSGKDLISGMIGKTQVKFSLLKAEQKYQETTTDSNGNSTTTTRYKTIFCGIFFVADFNKHVSGLTQVYSGASNWLSKLFGSNVTLEDPRFNALFSVKSTDQVEARYILTPTMMERVVELKQSLGDFNMSFVKGRMNMAIKTDYNLFDPNLSKPFTDQGQLNSLRSTLLLILGIVEDLDLNTRIWTKE